MGVKNFQIMVNCVIGIAFNLQVLNASRVNISTCSEIFFKKSQSTDPYLFSMLCQYKNFLSLRENRRKIKRDPFSSVSLFMHMYTNIFECPQVLHKPCGSFCYFYEYCLGVHAGQVDIGILLVSYHMQ